MEENTEPDGNTFRLLPPLAKKPAPTTPPNATPQTTEPAEPFFNHTPPPTPTQNPTTPPAPQPTGFEETETSFAVHAHNLDDDDTPWPTAPEMATSVPLEVLAAENAEEYQQDIPALMGRYSKKTPLGDEDRTKDFSRWEKSPTLVLTSAGFFLGVGILLILGILLRNITTIYGSFVTVRDRLTTAKTAFTRTQTIELAQSVDAIHLLWLFVALAVLYLHGKALTGIIFGTRGSLIWLRTTAAFWISIFLITLTLFPLEPWHSTLYTIIQWGSLPLGFALLSLSFTPKLRDWVKF